MANKKIFLSGGGTLGSVMPLLALEENLCKRYDCVWVGSFRGPEKEFVKQRKIKYFGIPSGKMRRYFSLKNILSPIWIWWGLKFSAVYLLIQRPSLIIVSGSFVSVPLVWIGWLLGIPIIIHQEDMQIGLAGKLTIPFASLVTVAFEKTLKDIKNKNKSWIGNPVRKMFYSAKTEEAKKKWKKNNLPLVLVLGGGLGSEKINKAVVEVARQYNKKCQILDITGKDKKVIAKIPNYEQIEKLDDEMAEAMDAADIIVSRAGLSTLSELAVLGKPVILIPLKSVGQDENARHFANKGAAIIVNENRLETLGTKIIELLGNKQKQKELGDNIKKIFPPAPAKKFLELAEKFLQ
ncbi:glycosyltransferase [Patescibacteria group bacterium]